MHLRPLRAAHVFLLLVASALAGRSPMGQGPQRVIGLIDNGGGALPIIVPDTVYVGVPFAATVTTFGGGCDQPDGADVQTSGLAADITPYDLLPAPGTICILILRTLPRSVELTFNVPGPGVVRVHGRSPNGNVTIQGSVTVRP